MNTKFKISRQIVITISVLLTAMRLPLTTFAQDFSKTGDLTQGANTLAENCAHCQTKHHFHDLGGCHHSHNAGTFSLGFGDWVSDDIVGFAETDPTIQQPGDILAVQQASSLLAQQVSAGFSESDPASNQFPEPLTVLSTSNSPAEQVFVGFSETDPTTNPYRSIGEHSSQHFVDYHCANAMGTTLSAPKLPLMTEMGSHHEHA